MPLSQSAAAYFLFENGKNSCRFVSGRRRIRAFLTHLRHFMTRIPNVGQTIYNAIVDLCNINRAASRQTLSEVTGLKLTIIDDHVKRMCDDGKIRRVVNGVFEPTNTREDRAVSVTWLANGECKLEVGDEVIELSQREARYVGSSLAGVALAFAQAGSA